MTSGALFNVFWVMGFMVCFALVIGLNIMTHMMSSFRTTAPEKAKTREMPGISDFSRSKVVQVLNGEVFTRLTHLFDTKKGLFNFAELQMIDKLGQPRGEPVLREGDFDDLINEAAGLPEGSLAFCSTPEFPGPRLRPLDKSQASRRMRRLPPPSVKALPAPYQLQ